MEARRPRTALVLREHKSGVAYYEVKWRSPALNGRQIKRRLGSAWMLKATDGTWQKRAGRPPDGYLDPRTAPGRADALIAEIEAELAAGRHADEVAASALPFRRLAGEWLKDLRRDCKPSTVRDYEVLLREPGTPHKRGKGSSEGRIMATFGDRDVRTITAREIADFLRTLDVDDFTPRNVNKYRQTLGTIFSYGCRAETYGLSANPVAQVSKRREPPLAVLNYYEVHEAERLADALAAGYHRLPGAEMEDDELLQRAIEDARDADLIRILFYAGLRLGEARSLRWQDVDVDARQLNINRNVSAGQEVDTPKGGRMRWVPLPLPAVEAFKRQQGREDFTGPQDLVFGSRSGGVLDDSALRRRYKAAAKAAGLRSVKLHGLRHAAGSIMARKATPVEVRDSLGHSKLSTTDRYVSARYSKDFFDRLDEAFTPRNTDPEKEGAPTS